MLKFKQVNVIGSKRCSEAVLKAVTNEVEFKLNAITVNLTDSSGRIFRGLQKLKCG